MHARLHAPHLRVEEKTLRYQHYMLPAMFNLLCSNTNQQLYKKNFCNQSSHYENSGRFNGSYHVHTTKSTLFVVNKYEWYTNEGRTKSMKNALYVQRYGKSTSQTEATSNSKKNQARTLSHC